MLPPKDSPEDRLNAGETSQWVVLVPPMGAAAPSKFIHCQAHPAHVSLHGWGPGSPASVDSLAWLGHVGTTGTSLTPSITKRAKHVRTSLPTYHCTGFPYNST